MKKKYATYLCTLLCVCFCVLLFSCSAQSKSSYGTITGRVDIGPVCPQEPCNPTPERWKQIYSAYHIVVMDTGRKQVRYTIPINADGTFNGKIGKGDYVAMIQPVEGNGFRTEETHFTVAKKKTTSIKLAYDTGLR
jgi:hypothetical protein